MDFSGLTIHAGIDNTGTALETPASQDKLIQPFCRKNTMVRLIAQA